MPESVGRLASSKGIQLGVAIGSHQLREGSPISSLLRQQELGLVPEWEMKWHALRPAFDKRETTGLDAITADAVKRGVPVRGHTLVWHSNMPNWSLQAMRSGNGHALLREHIAWLAERYRGIISSWDVVNEAIWIPHGNSNGLRSSPWLEALGTQYVELAYRTARTYLPSARLVYNDYNIEYEASKADAILRLVRTCRDKGAPIDAVGLQSHLFTSQRVIDESALKNFCRACHRDGIQVLLTELDVREVDFTVNTAVRDELVARVLGRYLDIVFSEIVPKEIYFWGLTDAHSWLNVPKYNSDNPHGNINRGLLFDQFMQPKPVFDVLVSKLKGLKSVR